MLRALLVFSIAFSVSVALVDVAQAQSARRVEFQLFVDGPGEEVEDRDRRMREHAEIAREAAERIEIRLDAIGVKNHRVRVNGQNGIDVTVYGRHDATAIKSAVIPPGRFQIRPVILDQGFWHDLDGELPDTVEIRQEPGSVQIDEVFLFSRNAVDLRRFMNRVAIAGGELYLFPHDDGFRTVQLGPALATDRDLASSELGQTPSAIPFVTIRLEAEVAQQLRATIADEGARQIGLILDDELIGMQGFSHRQFSETLTLECPSFLRSVEARRHWALQVGGRLATPIPITLVEHQEP
jgi:hypothetical protein